MIRKMTLSRPFIDCFYIQVENRGDFDARFRVQFVYKGKREVTESQVIKPFYKAKICVPMSAPNVTLTIKVMSQGRTKIVYNRLVPGNNNHCFYLTGDFNDVAFMELPC